MNFKNEYKSANDQIHADRSLIEKIEKCAAKEKGSYRPIYAYASAAAAVIVLCLIVGLPHLGGYKNVQTPASDYGVTEKSGNDENTNNTKNGITQESKSTEQAPLKEQASVADSETETKFSTKENNTSTDLSKNNAPAAAEQTPETSGVTEITPEKSGVIEITPKAPSVTEITPKTHEENNGASSVNTFSAEEAEDADTTSGAEDADGGKMMTMLRTVTEDETTYKELSKKEYLDRVGLKESTLAVKDMKLVIPDTFFVETDNDGVIISDIGSFTYVSVKDENNYAVVTAMTAEQEDTKAVIESDGYFVTAHAISNGTEITVDAFGVSDNKVAEIVASVINKE